MVAVCNSEGHVKVYRPPFCDFCAEWIEVCAIEVVNFMDLESILSAMAYNIWNMCSKRMLFKFFSAITVFGFVQYEEFRSFNVVSIPYMVLSLIFYSYHV